MLTEVFRVPEQTFLNAADQGTRIWSALPPVARTSGPNFLSHKTFLLSLIAIEVEPSTSVFPQEEQDMGEDELSGALGIQAEQVGLFRAWQTYGGSSQNSSAFG